MKKIVMSSIAIATLTVSVYATCANNVDMGEKKITTSATSFSDNELVSKAYVNQLRQRGNTAITPPSGYGVIYAGGRAWLDRNVGATAVASDWNDTTQATLGSLFQWGRKADGHQFRNGANDNNDADADVSDGNGGTTECFTDDSNSSSDFILGANSSGGYNWRTTATDCNADARRTHFWSAPGDLYNGVCPAGWRVPSEQDFRALDIESAEDAYAKIKLSAAGLRDYSNGSIYNVGSRGYYWTSSVDGDRSRNLNINSGSTNFNSNDRAYGFSVRCVKHLVD